MTEIAAISKPTPTSELIESLIAEVEEVFHGKEEVVRLAVAALLARGIMGGPASEGLQVE